MQAKDAQTTLQTWRKAAEQAKRGVNSMPFYRALDASVPIAWEDDLFAVGMPPVEGQISAAINSKEYQNVIERALRDVTGSPDIKFRLIEGTTYKDWQYAQQRDASVVTGIAQNAQRQTTETAAFASWEEIYERVSRLWSTTDNRSLAIGRGRYMTAAFEIVEEAVTRLYPADGGKPDDLNERGLSRVLERVGSYTNTDPAVLAYLLLQRKK